MIERSKPTNPPFNWRPSARERLYLGLGAALVAGWLNPFSGLVLASLSSFQRRQGFAGSVGEIGVHHGKLFTLLHLGRDAGSSSFAVDAFDRQDLNVDRSGCGDEAKFRRNVSRWSDVGAVEVFRGSSQMLRPRALLERVARPRLISIDGGHTSGQTAADLKLAEAVGSAEMIVVLDDVFHAYWPGVLSGLAEYISGGGALRPFAVTPGKVLMARPEICSVYQAALRDAFPLFCEKQEDVFGSSTLVVGVRAQQRPVRTFVRRCMRRLGLADHHSEGDVYVLRGS